VSDFDEIIARLDKIVAEQERIADAIATLAPESVLDRQERKARKKARAAAKARAEREEWRRQHTAWENQMNEVVLSIECSTCGAPVGEPCHTASGRQVNSRQFSYQHRPRDRAARAIAGQHV
jgi:hypothetical protein